jgi:hypothetical protein
MDEQWGDCIAACSLQAICNIDQRGNRGRAFANQAPHSCDVVLSNKVGGRWHWKVLEEIGRLELFNTNLG